VGEKGAPASGGAVHRHDRHAHTPTRPAVATAGWCRLQLTEMVAFMLRNRRTMRRVGGTGSLEDGGLAMEQSVVAMESMGMSLAGTGYSRQNRSQLPATAPWPPIATIYTNSSSANWEPSSWAWSRGGLP
jgi:hypothetical protein